MAARTLLGCRSQRQWRLNPLSTTFQLWWPWMSRSPSLSLRFLTHSFIHSFSAPSTSGVAPPLGISVSTHAGKCTQVRCAGDRCLSAQREVERGVRHSGAGLRLGRPEGPAPGDRGGAGERGRRDQPGGAARCSRMLPEPVQRAPREPGRERCCFIVVYLAICWELKRRVKKSWEEAALEARARGRPTATQRRAPGISRHSALPPSLASKTRMGFTGHQPRKASLLGIASRRSRPGAPTGSRACSGLQVPVWDQLLEPRPVPVGLSCCQAGVGCAGEEAAGPRTAVLPEGTRATVRHPAGSAGREGTRRAHMRVCKHL